MTATIKTPAEVEKMRVAGRLAADVLEMIEPYVKAGVTTDELNTICHNYIVNEQQAIPAPLNYHGFPKSICTSVNQVICHGIPADKQASGGFQSLQNAGMIYLVGIVAPGKSVDDVKKAIDEEVEKVIVIENQNIIIIDDKQTV